MAEKSVRKKTTHPGIEGEGGGNVSLSLADIKELFVLMRQNEIAEMNLEHRDTKIHIVSTRAQQWVQQAAPMLPVVSNVAPLGLVPVAPPQAQPQAPVAGQEVAPAPAAAPSAAEAVDAGVPPNVKTINSPMVGTFYRAPAPDAPMFVNVGDIVTEESVLCIIEAMKLMNELKAETKGRIYKILLENGNPVEYNQPLFLIEPA